MATQISFLRSSLRIVHQSAWAEPESLNSWRAARFLLETATSFHRSYVGLRETRARCNRDRPPRPRKQSCGGSQPRVAAEKDSAAKHRGSTLRRHRFAKTT